MVWIAAEGTQLGKLREVILKQDVILEIMELLEVLLSG